MTSVFAEAKRISIKRATLNLSVLICGMGALLGTLREPVHISGKSWPRRDASSQSYTVRTCIKTDTKGVVSREWCAIAGQEPSKAQGCRRSCVQACRAAKQEHAQKIRGFPGAKFMMVCAKDCRLACNQPSDRVSITEFKSTM